MKQDIENIIKKNLPEKNWRNKWNCHQVGCDWNRNRVYGNKVCDMNCENVLDNISQINTSLIADEVLKVVVEKIEMLYGDTVTTKKDIAIPHNCIEYETALDDVVNLLSNLSPNKENKNNEEIS